MYVKDLSVNFDPLLGIEDPQNAIRVTESPTDSA